MFVTFHKVFRLTDSKAGCLKKSLPTQAVKWFHDPAVTAKYKMKGVGKVAILYIKSKQSDKTHKGTVGEPHSWASSEAMKIIAKRMILLLCISSKYCLSYSGELLWSWLCGECNSSWTAELSWKFQIRDECGIPLQEGLLSLGLICTDL